MTANLGAELAADGKRVVTIDLDPQATLTRMMLGRVELATGTAQVLVEEATIGETLVDAPAFGLRLVPSSPVAMRVADRMLAARVGGERTLRRALSSFSDADFILIDCPPSLGILTAAALAAAGSGALVPVSAAGESLEGLADVK